MSKKLTLAAVASATALAAGIAFAQYPLIDLLAGKVVEKVQGASCEQLWESRSKPKSEQEQRLIALLRSDPGARQEFINRIAGPVANKMFECGLIP